MSSIDRPAFFESVSLVDEVLDGAPGFAAMDFTTRDSYRARIELLSRRSGRSEIEVALDAVLLARSAAREGPAQEPPAPTAPSRAEEDPGYYLVAAGRRALERRLGFRIPWRIRLRRICRAVAIPGYLGGIGASPACCWPASFI